VKDVIQVLPRSTFLDVHDRIVTACHFALHGSCLATNSAIWTRAVR
jgi:hypothetical protein